MATSSNTYVQDAAARRRQLMGATDPTQIQQLSSQNAAARGVPVAQQPQSQPAPQTRSFNPYMPASGTGASSPGAIMPDFTTDQSTSDILKKALQARIQASQGGSTAPTPDQQINQQIVKATATPDVSAYQKAFGGNVAPGFLDSFKGNLSDTQMQIAQDLIARKNSFYDTQAQDIKDAETSRQQTLANKQDFFKTLLSIPSSKTITDPITGQKVQGLASDNVIHFTDANGNTMLYDTDKQSYVGQTDPTGNVGAGHQGDSSLDVANITQSPQGTISVNGSVIPDAAFKDAFDVGQTGIQCGHYTNTNSTAPKVGDSWASKVSLVSNQDSPKAGDVLVTPVATGADAQYGHARLVLGYDPKTDIVWGTQANADGKTGTVTMWHGKLADFTQQYQKYNKDGKPGWGFINGELKGNAAKVISKYGNEASQSWIGRSLGGLATAATDALGMNEGLGKRTMGQEQQPTQTSQAPTVQSKIMKDPALAVLSQMGVNVTDPNYDKVSSSLGGLSQQAVDKTALDYFYNDKLPPKPTGKAGSDSFKQATAVKNAYGNLPGGIPAVNKGILQSSAASLKQQTSQMDQTTKGLQIADSQFQNLMSTFAKSGINANDSQFANTQLNELAKKFTNSSDLKAFQAGLNDVSTAYAQVFASQTGSSNAGNIKTAQDIMDGNMSMGDLQTIMKTMQSQGQIDIQKSQQSVQQIQQRMNNILTGGSPDTGTQDSGQRTIGGQQDQNNDPLGIL